MRGKIVMPSLCVCRVLIIHRFGPEALAWSQCTTLREYVRHGLLQASGFYIVSLCSLVFFSFVNPSSTVSYVSAYTHITNGL